MKNVNKDDTSKNDKTREVTITGIYITPHANVEKEMEALMQIKLLSRGGTIINRDLNTRPISWDVK